jgi:hypothetical protein
MFRPTGSRPVPSRSSEFFLTGRQQDTWLPSKQRPSTVRRLDSGRPLNYVHFEEFLVEMRFYHYYQTQWVPSGGVYSPGTSQNGIAKVQMWITWWCFSTCSQHFRNIMLKFELLKKSTKSRSFLDEGNDSITHTKIQLHGHWSPQTFSDVLKLGLACSISEWYSSSSKITGNLVATTSDLNSAHHYDHNLYPGSIWYRLWHFNLRWDAS